MTGGPTGGNFRGTFKSRRDSVYALTQAVPHTSQLLTFDPELYSQKGNKVFLDICRPKSADGIPNPQISPSST